LVIVASQVPVLLTVIVVVVDIVGIVATEIPVLFFSPRLLVITTKVAVLLAFGLSFSGGPGSGVLLGSSLVSSGTPELVGLLIIALGKRGQEVHRDLIVVVALLAVLPRPTTFLGNLSRRHFRFLAAAVIFFLL
jgi:hypothetical protein